MRHENPTDPLRVCEAAVNGLRDEAAGRGVILSFACDGPIPRALVIAEDRLSASVRELLAPAIEGAVGEVTLTAAYGRGALHLEADRGRGRPSRLHVPAEAVGASTLAAPPSLEGLKVLVVDDSAVNRALARTLMSGLGAEVSEAEDGPTGLERAAVTHFDAILMDIRMPGLSGHAALAQLRGAAGPNRDTPVLAYTANIGPEERQARGLDRFDGIIAKPVAPLQLARAVAAVTRRALDGVDAARTAASG